MRLLKTSLQTGLPFGIVMGGIFAMQNGVLPGLLGGLVAGIMFGLLLAIFAEVQRRKLQVGKEFEGEPVLHQGPANHWRGREARGGWLILTPRRLLFRAHGKNFNNQPVELRVADLLRAEPSRTLGIIPNGLRVHLADGSQERFVVSASDQWVVQLEATMNRVLP